MSISRFGGSKFRTYPFSEMNVHMRARMDEKPNGRKVNRFRVSLPYQFNYLQLVGEPNNKWWSFYVWYMDKNRPLPRGSVFVPYREKDWTRREAAGSPNPLYPAYGVFTARMGFHR